MTHGHGGHPFDGPVGGDPFAPRPATPPSTPPAGPGGHPPTVETNTLATLSVVFAFVFAPVGAILGHLGLGQIARTGQRGRDRALTGVTLSYVVLTATVVGLVVWAAGGNDAPTVLAAPPTTTAPDLPTPTTTTTVTTTPPPPSVAPAALPGILLDTPQLQTLLGEPALAPVWTTNALGLQPERGGLQDTSCAGAFFKGTPMAYTGNEPLQFTGTDVGIQSTGLLIGQGAAVYPDAGAARQALTAYLQYWRGCTGKSTQTIPATTLSDGFVALTLTFDAPVELGNGITKLDTTVVPTGGTFTHLLAVKNNVLLDSIFIGSTLDDIPVRVTQAMLDRIPT